MISLSNPPLPDWLSFLAGLPEAVRRRRYLMPIQVYVDDSGGKDHSRHFVLAGLIGHSDHWVEFTKEWEACLKEPPSIPLFKMREAAKCRGPWHGCTRTERDAKLRLLARIINRYAQIATHSIIDLDAHAKTWELQGQPGKDPYFWPFHNTIMAACFALWDAGWKERFEIIFDENLIFGPRAKVWYPVVKSVVQRGEPEASRIMPTDPIFRTDDEFLPLQAADLFAWCFRAAADNPNYKEFEWLLGEMQSVKSTDYSQYYDYDRMKNVGDDALRLYEGGLIPADIQEEYRRIWETVYPWKKPNDHS